MIRRRRAADEDDTAVVYVLYGRSQIMCELATGTAVSPTSPAMNAQAETSF